MAKVVVFLLFLAGLAVGMNLVEYQDVTPTTERFDFDKQAKNNKDKKAELELLLNPPKVEEKEEVVVAEGPLVELSTPQLESGHGLYKKCQACHGKRGNGKKAQKAPAIGGQHDWYLAEQITKMRDGIRINKAMNAFVKNLSDQDIADLAAYISKLPFMGRK